MPKGKQNLHFPRFGALEQWLEVIGVSADFLERESWQDIIDEGNKLRPTVAQKTLQLTSKNDPDVLKAIKKVELYLGEEEAPEKAEVIFVFGSRDLGRIRKAVSFWRKRLASKILITGRSRYDTKEKQEPEAIVFKREALKLGVPEENLLVESSSITIGDNVRSGLNLLDKEKLEYRTIMTIVAWFAQRRAWAHLMKYVPEGTKIIRVNSDIGPESPLATVNWHQNEAGINVVFGEFLKMKMALMLNTA